jgi:hypothetical protein
VSTALQVSHPPATTATPSAVTHVPRVSVGQLRRFQWAVRATLTVGVAASVCANVLHARDNPISQAIAAWPPMALLLTVELVSRVPVHRRLLGLARIGGTTVIAGIAAYVSYFHMAAVVSRYGEHQPNPYLLPLSVDGLIVVASVSLVELSGRVRAALDRQAGPDGPAVRTEHGTVASDAAPSPRTKASGSQAANSETQPPRQPLGSPPLEPATVPATPDGGSRSGHDTNGKRPSIPLTPLPPAAEATDLGTPADALAGADPDLVALLPAARSVRDELLREGRSLSRDSLARQLRRQGHTIRTSRVSELLTLLKNDATRLAHGHRPHRPDDRNDPA